VNSKANQKEATSSTLSSNVYNSTLTD